MHTVIPANASMSAETFVWCFPHCYITKSTWSWQVQHTQTAM